MGIAMYGIAECTIISVSYPDNFETGSNIVRSSPSISQGERYIAHELRCGAHSTLDAHSV